MPMKLVLINDRWNRARTSTALSAEPAEPPADELQKAIRFVSLTASLVGNKQGLQLDKRSDWDGM
jgi:hypothetical protein